ncbi:MAG: glycosyltransferase [Anaerolineales bacterium]|nr:glycosyltransferase [Anaerolineales bacterium]
MPKVSVVMSVHNNQSTLHKAIDSILLQTMPDFEFIIICDAPTDGSDEILKGYQDPRIKVMTNEENLGLTASLNKGLSAAKGTYIARMDADDLAFTDRFQKQINFLDANPDIGLLGSAVDLIDEEGVVQGKAFRYFGDLLIRWVMLFRNPFCHSSIMIRKSILDENNLKYDENFITTQDYDLWSRVLPHTKGENLQESIIQYRVGTGLGNTRRKEQLANHDKVVYQQLKSQFPTKDITYAIAQSLRRFFAGKGDWEPDQNDQKNDLISFYLSLFEDFCQVFCQSLELRSLKNYVSWQTMKKLMRPPIQPGWLSLFKQLVRLSPSVLNKLPVLLIQIANQHVSLFIDESLS